MLSQRSPWPLEKVTPGFQLCLLNGGRETLRIDWGKTYDFYDLASLTKILFPVTACLLNSTPVKATLHRDLCDLLPWWTKRGLSLFQLLTHTGGLPWWRPFYLQTFAKNPQRAWLQLTPLLRSLRRSPRTKAIYSDVDFLFLGKALEVVLDKPLAELWTDVSQFWSNDLHFNIGGKTAHARERYAPTEKDPRGRGFLQGLVHDDNARVLGGMAPHAGLFGSLDAVVACTKIWRRAHRQGCARIPMAWMKTMTRRAVPVAVGDWGLGFMKPTPKTSSAGRWFSPSSFGHTGFTGTSVWMDPRRDVIVVILANRVHPTRRNKKFQKLRPLLHDLAQEVAR